ncbi:MAG: hypothetical protein DDT39_00012 [Firmicutes bacterium]|nr:hypothetical protein [candidate division NPL-UPA2 bacterium]
MNAFTTAQNAWKHAFTCAAEAAEAHKQAAEHWLKVSQIQDNWWATNEAQQAYEASHFAKSESFSAEHAFCVADKLAGEYAANTAAHPGIPPEHTNMEIMLAYRSTFPDDTT